MATPELHKRTGHRAKLTDPGCESQPASRMAVLAAPWAHFPSLYLGGLIFKWGV